MGSNQPFINVEILGQIGGQAGRGRGTLEGVHGKVVGTGLLHRQVLEIEAVASKPRQGA